MDDNNDYSCDYNTNDEEDDNNDYNSNDDDPSFDDEVEDDICNNAQDIADKMGARKLHGEEDYRFDQYEILADAASLRGIDMVEPIESSTSLTLLKVSKKGKGSGKGRSATKGAGFCMRKFNINWSWRDVSEGNRKLMWEDTMNLFHIADEKRLRRNFLSLVAKRFRDFKSKLVSGWITKTRERSKFEDGRDPPQIWKHIKEEDWSLFKKLKTSSPAKRKREKAVENAKKNEHHHHLGQNDFNTARPIWIRDRFYPGSTPTPDDSSTTVEVNRADDWFCAMHLKDKETGEYVIKKPQTKEVAERLLELRAKQAKGEFIPKQNKDVLYYALGEKDDHPSRARGFGGVNVSVKQAFGPRIGKIDRSRKNGTSFEDREALKNELREELNFEMKLEVKSSVSCILQELGLSGLKLPNNATDDVNHTCLNHAEQVHLKQNHLQPLVPSEIKDNTPCHLLLKDPHSGLLYEVARGKAFPGNVCHQSSVRSDQLRVKVSIVPQEFEAVSLPEPVPAYDLNMLRDAVGSFVLWPIELVRIENEGSKEREIMGSNSNHSRLSATPIKTHSEEVMVESLSLDCQWLNKLVDTMVDGETCNIYFDANLFYYGEDGKTEIYKDDLKKFLEGSELSISIIQIFARALQDDMMKVDSRPRIGWLCPDATSDAKLNKKLEVAIAYVTKAFLQSATNGHEIVLAPIIDSKHWLLLAICPQNFTIYEFDSITLKEGRKLFMKMVVLSALKRYKLSGGQIKLNRKEPLWKYVKCPQQNGSLDHGYFTMRFMYDIVKSCTTANDLEKVWNSQIQESYTDYEVNEIRDKWAMYFINRCIC